MSAITPIKPDGSSSSLTLSDLHSDITGTSDSSVPHTESDDDDSDGPVVFFGKPSEEEQQRRREYEAKLRRRKLIRRDSLDLARRKTIVYVDGDETEPEQERTPPQHKRQRREASQEPTLPLLNATEESTPPQQPLPSPNAEASILNRSLLPCTPTSALASGSFSMDQSPGLGRALVATPSDAIRRFVNNDILDDLYASPAGSSHPDENATRGSYIEMSQGDRKARRRSARLSLGVPSPSPAKPVMLDASKPQQAGESPERKVLGDMNGSAQHQEREAFESPSAKPIQRSRSRSRSASPLKRHQRSDSEEARLESPQKSSRKAENLSPSRSQSPTKSVAVMTSPTVRNALKAWAGAKMMTPYSPDKRVPNASVIGFSLPTPQSAVAERTIAAQSLSSPVRAPLASVERPGAALFAGGLRSPTKAPFASAPARVELEHELVALDRVGEAVSAASPAKVIPPASQSSPQRPTLSSSPETHELPLPSPAKDVAFHPGAAPLPSTLHAPRIARTLQASAGPITQAQAAVRAQPITASSVNRSTALRKPELTSAQPRTAAEELSVVPPTGPSTAAKKAVVSSGLPRPIGGALPSRLPKPAAFKSAVPTVTSRPVKAPTAPVARTATVSAAPATTSAKPTTASQRGVAPISNRPVAQPSVASEASLAASRAGAAPVPTRKPLGSSSSTRSVALRGTGGAMRHPIPPSRTSAVSETEQPTAAPVQETVPAMSMLERSLQMQARALARISPDQGEAKANVGDSSTIEQASQGRTVGSASRVWSPVKPSGTAARLGASNNSPVRQPEYLRRERDFGSSGANSVPPSRFGVSVSTGSATASAPAVATSRAVRGVSPMMAASATPRVVEHAPSEQIQPSSSLEPAVAPRVRTARARVVRAETRALQEGNSSSPQPTSEASTGSTAGKRTRAVRSAAAAASTRISKAAAAVGGSSKAPFTLSSSTSSNGMERAPVLPMSAAELTRLTSQHTRRNEVYLAKLDVRVERREGPRPPSPSPMTREEPSVESSRKRGKRIHDDEEDEEDMFQLNRHMLGKGDEELYTTPPKLAATLDAKPKGVRWYKQLFVGPTVPSEEEDEEEASRAQKRARRKSCIAPKEYRLDRHGNPIESELKPLSPRMRKTKVLIKKVVYDDDEQL